MINVSVKRTMCENMYKEGNKGKTVIRAGVGNYVRRPGRSTSTSTSTSSQESHYDRRSTTRYIIITLKLLFDQMVKRGLN